MNFVILFYIIRLSPPLGVYTASYQVLDSSNVRFVGNWPFGESNTLWVEDSIAFLGSGGGIFILNVSDPDHIVKIGEIRTEHYIKKIVYNNNYLFVASGKNHFEIWNVVSFNDPIKLSEIVTDGSINDFFIRDNKLFITESESQMHQLLQIFDISDLTLPFLVGELRLSAIKIMNIFVDGNFAYITESPNWFRIIDVRNPHDPQEICRDSTITFPNNIYVLDSILYLFTDNGMEIFDVKTHAFPRRIGNLDLLGGIRSASFNGNMLYAVGFIDSLYIINVANPSLPCEMNSIHVPDSCIEISVNEDYAYLANREGGLVVIDLSKKEKILGGFEVPYRLRTFEISGNYCYLPDLNGTLWILDKNNVESPQLITSLHISDYGIWDISLSRNLLSLIDVRGNLKLLDISDPSNPNCLSHINVGGATPYIFLKDDIIYETDMINGLQIIDINDPNNPQVISSLSFDVPTIPTDIYVDSNYVYITDGSNSVIWIANVNNVYNPRWITSIYLYSSNEYPTSIFVDRNFGFITTRSGRVWIYDFNNPFNPQLFTTWNNFNSHGNSYALRSIYIFDNKVFITGTGFSDSKIWVKREDSTSSFLGYHSASPQVMDIRADEQYIYTIDYTIGLSIYQLYNTDVSESNVGGDSALTNKANIMDRFNFSFEVPLGKALKLELYSITGRLIWRANFREGRYTIRKNIRPGIYFLYGNRKFFKKIIIVN